MKLTFIPLILFLYQAPLLAESDSGYWKIEAFQKDLSINFKHSSLSPSLNLKLEPETQIQTNSGLALMSFKSSLVWIGPFTDITIHNLWDKGPTVIINKGPLRIQGPVFIKSPLGECPIPQKADVLLEWKPETSTFKMAVLKGSVTLPCFDYEKTYQLSPDEFINFSAVLDSNQNLTFDKLASGRTLPRGHLTEPAPWPQSEKSFWTQGEKQLKTQKSPPKVKKRSPPKGLCEKPKGDFGKCVYICKNIESSSETQKVNPQPLSHLSACNPNRPNKCFRYTCTAEGKWAYELEMPITFDCPKVPKAQECQ